MNIVLIETSGNQRYIFATNKLRENVGASELTYRVGTRFVLEAVETETTRVIYEDNDLDGRKMRANLLDPRRNPPVGNGNKVEVITATSGKALLLVEGRTTGERIVRAVTSRALRLMPGLTVHGAISEDFSDDLEDVHKAIGEVHRKLERVRYEMPSNEQRFLRLPFIAPCATSGLPAREAQFFKLEGRYYNRSAVTIAKLSANKKYLSEESGNGSKELKRIEAVIKSVAPMVELPSNLYDLEKKFKDLNWLSVIHADGNGLGQIFLNFDEYTGFKKGECDARAYVEKYRRFSLALDICTINAAGRALENLRKRFRAEEEEKAKRQGSTQIPTEIPVVPLVLGGDDLTILCDGQYALKFTQEFLTNFEAETAKDHFKEESESRGIVPQIAFNAFGVHQLGICAGVAIVKPHFPFHQAYELAEQLLKSAKQVKEKIKRRHNNEDVPHPCSALDYHILYDSTASQLEDIRDRLKADDKSTWLYARPYVVSNIGNEYLSNDWLRPRKSSELDNRLAVMIARDDDNKRKLPNNQLHTLREALFLGKRETDARTRLVNHRYDDMDFDKLLWDPTAETLFFEEKRDGKDGHATHFLDALDIVEFRKGEEEEDGKLSDKRSGDDASVEQPTEE